MSSEDNFAFIPVIDIEKQIQSNVAGNKRVLSALDSFLLTNLLYQDFIFILIYLVSLQKI